MGISTKLIMAFFEVTLLVLLIGFLGVRNIRQVQSRFDSIVEETAPALEGLNQCKASAMRIHLTTLGLATGSANRSAVREGEEELQELRLNFEKGRAEFSRKAEDSVEKGFADEIGKAALILFGATSRLVEEMKKGGGEIAREREALEGAEKALTTLIDRALVYESAKLKSRDAEAHQAVQRSRQFTFVASVIALLVATVVGYLISRQIARPIGILSTATKQIKEGDLAHRVEVRSKDEIGELSSSFNGMAEAIETKNRELELTNQELRETNRRFREVYDKLVQQEKMAAVGQLASGVGHELRNPLGVIKNAIYYLRSKVGQGDEKVLRHFTIMEREIENSNKIINDLLGFSRTKKPTLVPHPFNDILKEAISTVEVPSHVTVTQELTNGLPNAMMDAGQIRQVFINLVLNGIQAMGGMPKGVLQIRTRQEKDFVVAEVRDTGSGISKENMGKLFDPFFTTKSSGIGLGLAVTRGIIEKHRGRIEVSSEVGKGTLFVVRLPMEVKQAT